MPKPNDGAAVTDWLGLGVGFLDILWLASSALTTSIWPPVGSLCSLNPDISNLDGACADIQTSMAFGWLNWLIRMPPTTAEHTLALLALF